MATGIRTHVFNLLEGLLFRSYLLLLNQAGGGSGKAKFAGRGRVDTIRGGSFLGLKLYRRRQRLVRKAAVDLFLCFGNHFGCRRRDFRRKYGFLRFCFMERRSFFCRSHDGVWLQILGRDGNFLVIGGLFLHLRRGK